jgi:hypothetical protein
MEVLDPAVNRYSSLPNIGSGGRVNWAQLSRFYLKTETESSLRNIVYLNKNRKMVIFLLFSYSMIIFISTNLYNCSFDCCIFILCWVFLLCV